MQMRRMLNRQRAVRRRGNSHCLRAELVRPPYVYSFRKTRTFHNVHASPLFGSTMSEQLPILFCFS